MNNITALLSLLGQNGLMPAAIPSAVYIFVILLLLNPSKLLTTIQNLNVDDPLIIFSLIIIIPIIILSFTLTALNNFILKLLQGYIIFPPIRFLYEKTRNIHIHKAKVMQGRREELKKRIRQMEENNVRGGPNKKMKALQDQYYQAVTNYNLAYPENLDDILPTQFGNILKAAETYSGERYGFDGVHFWPRFISVIPTEYKTSINSTRNELSFHVNMAIVSILFSIFCILAIYQHMWVADMRTPVMYFQFLQEATKYLLAAMTGLLSGRFFYGASILSLIDFGLMMRSSSDLFRLDLLKKIGVERPKDSIEEFDTWHNINELIVLGNQSLTFRKLKYRKEE